MSIQNQQQLENTRSKLRELEERRAELKREPTTESACHARELTIRSFGNLIKQLKEEIMRYEAHATKVS